MISSHCQVRVDNYDLKTTLPLCAKSLIRKVIFEIRVVH